MNILGPDYLVFGVDDVAACTRFLVDYGLRPVGVDAAAAGSSPSTARASRSGTRKTRSCPRHSGRPAPCGKTVYGVADEATLERIARELRKDRDVTRLSSGALNTVDDAGFALGFQLSVRSRSSCRRACQRSRRAAAAARQRDRRASRRRNQATHALACRLLRSGQPQGRSLLSRASRIHLYRSIRQHRPLHAPGRHARSPHAVPDPGAALHEGLRAFHLPPRRPHRGAAGRAALRRQGLPDLLGPGSARLRARTGSGTSTARSAATSSTTPTWICTTMPGSRAKRRSAWTPRRCSCSRASKSGCRPAVRRRARVAAPDLEARHVTTVIHDGWAASRTSPIGAARGFDPGEDGEDAAFVVRRGTASSTAIAIAALMRARGSRGDVMPT